VAGSGYTKKELLILKREKDKLEKTLGGIRDDGQGSLGHLGRRHQEGAPGGRRGRKLGLPVIAILDTNCDPDEVDYKIPGNDDAIRSVTLLTRVIADAVADGLIQRSQARATGESADAGVAADEPLAEWERELYAEAAAGADAAAEAPVAEAAEVPPPRPTRGSAEAELRPSVEVPRPRRPRRPSSFRRAADATEASLVAGADEAEQA
jgi:small subunit ribosomal protein S2